MENEIEPSIILNMISLFKKLGLDSEETLNALKFVMSSDTQYLDALSCIKKEVDEYAGKFKVNSVAAR